MIKAGAVYEKKLSEWFDPASPSHLKAREAYRLLGHFPANFLPAEVYPDLGWQEAVAEKVGPNLPGEVTRWVGELHRVRAIVAGISYSGYSLVADVLGEDFCLRLYDRVPFSGPVGPPMVLPAWPTEYQVVDAAFDLLFQVVQKNFFQNFFYKNDRWRAAKPPP